MNNNEFEELKNPIKEGLFKEDVQVSVTINDTTTDKSNEVETDKFNDVFYKVTNRNLRFNDTNIKFLKINNNEYINIYNICTVKLNSITKEIDTITLSDGTFRNVESIGLTIDNILK